MTKKVSTDNYSRSIFNSWQSGLHRIALPQPLPIEGYTAWPAQLAHVPVVSMYKAGHVTTVQRRHPSKPYKGMLKQRVGEPGQVIAITRLKRLYHINLQLT